MILYYFDLEIPKSTHGTIIILMINVMFMRKVVLKYTLSTFKRNFKRKTASRWCYQTRYIMDNGQMRVIDFRSDTVSKPTPEMRKAMFEAEVGDDVYGEDPTVNALEAKAAAMLGKDSALFIPSGTMGNMLAIMVHCTQRGCEMIAGELSHTFLFEQGGPAQIGGVQVCTLPNKSDGTFDLDLMESKVREDDDHEPVTSLICVENTQNWCGGKVLPLEWLDDLVSRAQRLGIPLHMDGARLFNAAVHLRVPVSRVVKGFDSVSFCISKGLAAPVGAILVGSNAFIRKARRLRKVMGGGMRQAGILAAAGIVALDNMVDRLEEDHVRAHTIAKAIAESNSPVLQVDLEKLQTNILMIDINPKYGSSANLCERLAKVTEEESALLKDMAVIVKLCPINKQTARLVTYYEITDADVEAAVEKFRYIMDEYERAHG